MTILYFIILAGALLGFVLAPLLFFSRTGKKANRLLGILVFIIALAGINLYLEETGWYYISKGTAIFHALAPVVILMPVGPLIYFYSQAVTNPDFKIKRRQRLHFLPAIIDILPQLSAFLFLAHISAGYYKISVESADEFIEHFNFYLDIPRWFSITIYLFASSRYLYSISEIDYLGIQLQADKIKWLKRFINLFLLFQIALIPYIFMYTIPSFTNDIVEKFRWLAVFVPVSILIYYMGIKGYRNAKKMLFFFLVSFSIDLISL